MSEYPKVRFEWHPKEGLKEVPSKLWGCIMRGRQVQIRKLRAGRKAFRIVEHTANGYRIEQTSERHGSPLTTN